MYFSQLQSVTEETQGNAKFRNLFKLLTTEVSTSEYLSFDHDVETRKEAINTTQVDWCKTTQERCIKEITNNIVEKQMELVTMELIKNSKKLKWWVT